MQLLTKGLEEEIYTGTTEGDLIGISHRIAADLPHFSVEPDCRNTEYATTPHTNYTCLKKEILRFRCQLLRYLREHGGYTLVPGATLSLKDDNAFIRSDPNNPFHTYIEKTYGTRVVTTGAHLNLGIEDPDQLIRLYRLLRCEAFAYLALTACSPWLNGKTTGYHSTRWQHFPQTPQHIPLFTSHAHYIQWVEQAIQQKNMFNIRHLWLSIRPNGVGAPQTIQRLELRICDRIDRIDDQMALTALYEARAQQALEDPTLDPLTASPFSEKELILLIHENEKAVSKTSLDATITDWKTGQKTTAHQWIKNQLPTLQPIAKTLGFHNQLSGINHILQQGSPAKRWLQRQNAGESIRDILKSEITHLTNNEVDNSCSDEK